MAGKHFRVSLSSASYAARQFMLAKHAPVIVICKAVTADSTVRLWDGIVQLDDASVYTTGPTTDDFNHNRALY